LIKQSMTIFYVVDQQAATTFYQKTLQVKPVLLVPGMTEFKLDSRAALGLMPLTGIKKLLSEKRFIWRAPVSPQAELYLIVDDAASYLHRAVENGAQLLQAVVPRDWGDRVGYCLDPDGYVLAFAEPN